MSSTTPDAAILDRDHLARQTMGDAQLAAEILDLLAAELARAASDLAAAAGKERAAIAHRLKGAARGTGAFALGDAAQALERAPADDAALAAVLRRIGELQRLLGEASARQG